MELFIIIMFIADILFHFNQSRIHQKGTLKRTNGDFKAKTVVPLTPTRGCSKSKSNPMEPNVKITKFTAEINTFTANLHIHDYSAEINLYLIHLFKFSWFL